jgi:hypothetical protein
VHETSPRLFTFSYVVRVYIRKYEYSDRENRSFSSFWRIYTFSAHPITKIFRYAVVCVCLASASAVWLILFIFGISEFMRPRLVPGESEYCSSKSRRTSYSPPKYKTIFSKTALTILIKVKIYGELDWIANNASYFPFWKHFLISLFLCCY